MRKNLFHRLVWAIVLSSVWTIIPTKADAESITIAPLFEYPVAPDELPDLNSKTNYLMDHFWDPMDFKTNGSVDQNALNDAFMVYTSAIPYADSDKVVKSVKKLVKSIKNNTALTIQFLKAAEENLYGSRALIWGDDLYMMFLENYLADKKIDTSRKVRYEEQLRRLSTTKPGSQAPAMLFEFRNGTHSRFSPSKEFTIIVFGDPSCEDCRFAKMKLEISGVVSDLIYANKLEVIYVITDEDEDGSLMKLTENYPQKWTIAKSVDADEHYDLRATPSLYLIDSTGKIVLKNSSVDTILEYLRAQNSGVANTKGSKKK